MATLPIAIRSEGRVASWLGARRASSNPRRTITVKGPQAAGKIHTDFERGFIKAEVIWWEDLVTLGSEAACKAAGFARPIRRKDGRLAGYRRGSRTTSAARL